MGHRVTMRREGLRLLSGPRADGAEPYMWARPIPSAPGGGGPRSLDVPSGSAPGSAPASAPRPGPEPSGPGSGVSAFHGAPPEPPSVSPAPPPAPKVPFSVHRVPKGLATGHADCKRGVFRRFARTGTPGNRKRSAIVKARKIERVAGKATFRVRVRSYGEYLSRDGAGEDGEPAEFFEADGRGGIRRAAFEDFLEAAQYDQYVGEVVISPNDGHRVADMAGLAERVMEEKQGDLGTRLTWVAVVHEKPDVAHEANRHLHILYRGVDDRGRDLWISDEFSFATMNRIVQEELSAYPTNERERGWRLGRMSEEEEAALREQLEMHRGHREMAMRPRWQSRAEPEGDGTNRRRRGRDRVMGDDEE